MFTRFWVVFITLFISFSWANEAEKDVTKPSEEASANVNTAEKVDEFFKYVNEPRISLDYNRGEFLIYDCKKQSFICVNKESYELCTENRQLAKEEKKHNLSCAPLMALKSQKECFSVQITNIERARIKTYCYGEIKKLKL